MQATTFGAESIEIQKAGTICAMRTLLHPAGNTQDGSEEKSGAFTSLGSTVRTFLCMSFQPMTCRAHAAPKNQTVSGFRTHAKKETSENHYTTSTLVTLPGVSASAQNTGYTNSPLPASPGTAWRGLALNSRTGAACGEPLPWCKEGLFKRRYSILMQIGRVVIHHDA